MNQTIQKKQGGTGDSMSPVKMNQTIQKKQGGTGDGTSPVKMNQTIQNNRNRQGGTGDSMSSVHYQKLRELKDKPEALDQYLLDNALDIFAYFSSRRGPAKGLADLGKARKKTDNEKLIQRYRVANDPNCTLREESTESTCECGAIQCLDLDILICPKCGATETWFDMEYTSKDVHSYKITPYMLRMKYFDLYLDNLLGRNVAELPVVVVDRVRAEAKRLRIANVSEDDVRGILKKFELRKYYTRSFQIAMSINGQPLIYFNAEQERNIKTLFVRIQDSVISANTGRTTFSSLSFVFYKICQRLGYYEILPMIKLPRGATVISELEATWRCVCKDLGGFRAPTAVSTDLSISFDLKKAGGSGERSSPE
jgi:hypothetical protein